MAEVCSDSSTLIHLARLGRLDLLRELCGTVLIAPAVWREVVEEGRGRPGAQEVEVAVRLGWIRVLAPTNQDLVRLLRREVDAGEAETIALAVERQGALVLLDEADARRIAEEYAIRKTGVVGLLVRAKVEGRIPSLRRELERLRQEAGFRIADELVRAAVEAVGEDAP